MAATDPRTATQEQWEDLATKVKAKQDILTAGTGIDATELASDVVEIDSTVVTYDTPGTAPGSSQFVNTVNIIDGAVTTAKIADGAVTADKIDFSTFGSGNYSTTEQDTGFTWVNDKTIYRKTIIVDDGIPAGGKTVAHGITNMEMPVFVESFSWDGTTYRTIPYVPTGTTVNNWCMVECNTTSIGVYSPMERSSWTVYITIYYTKTTD